jgi:glutathione S-transferase
VHPLGKSPVIGIQAAGAEKPIIIAESATIVEYLTEHFGRELIPKRYEEGKEGAVGGENEGWLRYRVSVWYFFFRAAVCWVLLSFRVWLQF